MAFLAAGLLEKEKKSIQRHSVVVAECHESNNSVPADKSRVCGAVDAAQRAE